MSQLYHECCIGEAFTGEELIKETIRPFQVHE